MSSKKKPRVEDAEHKEKVLFDRRKMSATLMTKFKKRKDVVEIVEFWENHLKVRYPINKGKNGAFKFKLASQIEKFTVKWDETREDVEKCEAKIKQYKSNIEEADGEAERLSNENNLKAYEEKLSNIVNKLLKISSKGNIIKNGIVELNAGKDSTDVAGGEKRKHSFNDDELKTMIEEQVEKIVQNRNDKLFKDIEEAIEDKVNSPVIEAKVSTLVTKPMSDMKILERMTSLENQNARMKRGLAIAFGLTQDQEVNDEDSSDEQEDN